MRSRVAQTVLAGILGGTSVLLVGGLVLHTAARTEATVNGLVKIQIDYPLDKSVFPPEITPPTFLWRDESMAKQWNVEIRSSHSKTIDLKVPGDWMTLGPIDPEAGPGPQLTPQQQKTHVWKPDPATWDRIKRLCIDLPAMVTFHGLDSNHTVVSSGTVTISTSKDPVGAPVFYRDVPLILPSPDQTGPIAPLPPTAIPLIKWRIRSIGESESHVVMQNVPTCANCHSFSRDGKVMGLDMDGPRNDKGLYALVPVTRNITISNKNMIRWSEFELNQEASPGDAAVKRFGFMSQVSPDGRYVVTSIGAPNGTNENRGKMPGFAPGILDRLYSTNYRSVAFTQVFYPTRGILAWYDRKSGIMKRLPGADDPKFVQTSAFWSPDGKYLVFSRASARDPYPAGAAKSTYANDPNETQIQYDLYRIPFNEGRGGTAEPVRGASANGMSNNFPKVSPDGKWIVFVQCKNGLLMRPDSKLFIVPSEGGTARPLTANTALMNSWHTFSPNGRWLAFSSKARGPYTQLMLTHIDANGNDTPAIFVENTTASNRAENIPEFVNLPAGETIAKIDPQATEFYGLFDKAFKEIEANQMLEAIATMREAIAREPNDALAHYVLGTALSGNNQEADALREYRRAVELEPKNPTYLDHLAISLDLNGDSAGAIEQLRKVIAVAPYSAEFQFNLAVVLESRGDFAGAIDPLLKSIEYSHGKNWRCFAELAKAYDKTGQHEQSLQMLRHAIDEAAAVHENAAAQRMQSILETMQREPQPSTDH